MAFGNTRNTAFNQNVQRLLDYFLEQRLMKQRYGMMGQLQKEQQAGYLGLEEKEHQNLMTRMAKGWEYAISQDDEINRLQSEIFMGRREGKNTAGLEGLLEKRIPVVGQAAFRTVRGTPLPIDEQEIMKLTDITKRALLQEYGATIRQKEMIERVHEPSQMLQAIGVGQREKEIGIRGREVAAKERGEAGALTDQEKAYINLIGDTKKFLINEGVKPSDTKKLMQEMGTGRALDPLSAENRGMALQWLSEIEFKIINKKPLTPNDERFISSVMNTRGVEPTAPSGEITNVVPTGRPTPGGLVSPETGLTVGENQKINTVIDQKVKDRMYELIYQGFKNRGFNDEAAAFHTRNVMTQLK